MKSTIKNVTDIEFYSKHAGLKPAAIAILFIAQIGSGVSAFYGVLAVGGYSYVSIVLAFGLALICEGVVRYFGYQYFLSYAEGKTSVEVYAIGSDKRNLSKKLDRWKFYLLFIAGGTTTIFTLLGCFMYLFSTVEVPERLNINDVLAEQNKVAQEKANTSNATLLSSISMLEKDIAALEAQIAKGDERADKAQKEYNESKKKGEGKNGKGIWTTETSFYNLWRNGNSKKRIPPQRETVLAELNEKKATYLSLSTSVATTNTSFLGAASGTAQEIVEDNLEYRWEQIKEGAKKGAFGILGGLICQIIAFAMLFVIACIDLGSGTTKRYIRHFMDGRNVFLEFYLVLVNRFKMIAAYHISSYAKSDLKSGLFFGKTINANEAKEFIVEELYDDEGQKANEEAVEAPEEPERSSEAERLAEQARAAQREREAAEREAERLRREREKAAQKEREAEAQRKLLEEEKERVRLAQEEAQRLMRELREASRKEPAESYSRKPRQQKPSRKRKKDSNSREPITKACENCGETFQAATTRAKFCSGACRKNNHDKKNRESN